MKVILTIDQSTASTKILLIDTKGKIQDIESKNHRQIYPQNEWVEHDPMEIINNIYEIIDIIVQRNKNCEILAISITNQRETVVVWNRNTHKPVHNAIVWQCRRTMDSCNALYEYNDIVQEKTGLRIDPYFSATKIKWIFDTYQIQANDYCFGTIDSWIIYNLSNDYSHVCDHTNASRTLLYNIKEKKWDMELLSIFGLDKGILPKIKESNQTFGYTTLHGRIAAVPILGVMGDSQAALFAQMCFEEGDIKATIGTGTSILMNDGQTLTKDDNGLVKTVAWVLNDTPIYAKEAIINSSADTLNWMRDQLHLFETDQDLNDICQRHDAQGVVVVPAFIGLGYPYWMNNIKASIHGISRNTNQFNIICAGVESIAYQVFAAIRSFCSNITRIHVDGGGVQNPYLMQLIADLCRCEVIVNEEIMLSALGTSYMTLLGLEIVGSLADLKRLEHNCVIYKPKMDRKERLAKIKQWDDVIQLIQK